MERHLKRAIGVHVRLQDGLQDVVQVVEHLHLQVVQSFLLSESGAYVSVAQKAIDNFAHLKNKLKFLYFVHAAYWSSLVSVGSKEFISLCKEAEIALNLGSDGIVIHVGALRATLSKQDQVAYVAEATNELLRQVSDISILLENSPHAGRNFGGDLDDFGLLMEHIEQKKRVKFCLDTAHAFVYGYNLKEAFSRNDFFKLVQDTMGKDNIALLHLNDSGDLLSSHMDKHEVPGRGMIGQTALQNFMNHEICKNVPIIMELPAAAKSEELDILQQIQHWDR